MGQEERKNKAKLEKTQINLATSNTEYENAVKALEDTTGRWNRDWKAAADKFQDLEEERLDFMKSSLWSFANIASTVCVSDDASCEKVRLSLENCEVEKDIMAFIRERGTGQEIPDPPKYINFCRGDASDTASETSEDDNYSVAQFQRTINPAYRSSSPQPSTYESHHDPQAPLVRELGHDIETPPSREATLTPQKAQADRRPPPPQIDYQSQSSRLPPASRQPRVEDAPSPLEYQGQPTQPLRQSQNSRPSQPAQLEYKSQPSRQARVEDAPSQSEYQSQPPRQPQNPRYSQPAQLEYQSQPLRQSQNSRPSQPAQLEYNSQSSRHTISQQHQIEQATQKRLSYEQPPRRIASQQPQLEQPTQGRLAYEQPSRRIPSQQPQLEQAAQGRSSYEQSNHGSLAQVPHDPYPMDGMTMLCRTGPPSERSSAHSPSKDRPSSRESNSDYSNPTSFSSQEPPSGKTSPVKQTAPPPEKQVLKKKSGFFQSHSPFRRKSVKEKEAVTPPTSRNTWSARSSANTQNTPSRRPQIYGQDSHKMISDRPSGSPEPIDPRASFQLNVGNNVFDVQTPDTKSKTVPDVSQEEDLDPIAQALAELKGVTDKASSSRMSADLYHGVKTPAPDATPASRPVGSQMTNAALIAGMRGTPPPSYDQPMQRLGLPQPAHTAKAMRQATQKYVEQGQSVYNAQARPGSQAGYSSRPGTRGNDAPRATSPAPPRSVSPRPDTQAKTRQGYRSASPNPDIQTNTRQGYRSASPNPDIQTNTRQSYRSASPNPYSGSQRSRPQTAATPQKRGSEQGYYAQSSPNEMARTASPAPFREQERPVSSHADMAMQLAPGPEEYALQSGRDGSRMSHNRAMSQYGGSQSGQLAMRTRSKSVADVRQFNREGRPIIHFGKSSPTP